MEFVANPGKAVAIEADGQRWMRHAVTTRFVQQGDSYLDLIREYVSPIHQPGDIISISEKIIALCQGKVVKRAELPIGFWARLLSRFASHPTTGVGVGETIKMQYAIREAGLPRVLWATFASAVTKLVGKKGVFYEIVGQKVSGLDGFYDHVWDEYRDIGIELPEDPDAVCEEIRSRLGVEAMIVDANDLGQEVLGHSSGVTLDATGLAALIRDNPTGQGREQTPIVLIRPWENFVAHGDSVAGEG